MSEIYKRSLGQTYDPDALRRELDNGTAGYDTSVIDTPTRPLDTAAVSEYRVREELADIESEFFMELCLAEDAMAEVAIEHPQYTWHVGQILSERLDVMKQQGHPVDAEMYIEAQQLADEIVAANPDKDADELSQVVTAMVEMIQAEHRMHQLTLAA